MALDLGLKWEDDILKSNFVRLWATWFYLGHAPKAPGTVGTLGAVPLVWLLAQMGELTYMGIAFGLTIFAVFVAQLYEQQSNSHDAKEIVIDEVAGFVIAMTWVPLTWQSLVIGFAVFRFLDAVKPFPIGWMDRKIEGGLGVVADDVMAGVLTNIFLQVLLVKTAWLGVQWSAT